MDWADWCELIEESNELNPKIEKILIEENRVRGCTSKTWIAKLDNRVVGYSESVFVNGIIYLILSGKDISPILEKVTYQRRAGLAAFLTRKKELCPQT